MSSRDQPFSGRASAFWGPPPPARRTGRTRGGLTPTRPRVGRCACGRRPTSRRRTSGAPASCAQLFLRPIWRGKSRGDSQLAQCPKTRPNYPDGVARLRRTECSERCDRGVVEPRLAQLPGANGRRFKSRQPDECGVARHRNGPEPTLGSGFFRVGPLGAPVGW